MRHLEIETGCINNFNFETHKRGKNWIATVQKDRKSPGGLAREFWQRGSGSWCAIPTDLAAGDVLEFAGDYYSGGGSKRPQREYVKVIAITETYVEVTDPIGDPTELWDMSFEGANLHSDLISALQSVIAKKGIHDEELVELLEDNLSKDAILALLRWDYEEKTEEE